MLSSFRAGLNYIQYKRLFRKCGNGRAYALELRAIPIHTHIHLGSILSLHVDLLGRNYRSDCDICSHD